MNSTLKISWERCNIGGVRTMLFYICFTVFVGYLTNADPASASTYVDAGTTDIRPEDRVVVTHPQPVQLLFQFQTTGSLNAAVTTRLKDQVFKIVDESGLFSEISDSPVINGAVLSVTINNVVGPHEMVGAEMRGFVVGATFFLVGTNTRNNYVSTVDYISNSHAQKITKTAHHAVITQLGLINAPPKDAVEIGTLDDAVMTMARQIVANPLNEIARDPSFQAASAPTAEIPQRETVQSTGVAVKISTDIEWSPQRQALYDRAFALGQRQALSEACAGPSDQFWRARLSVLVADMATNTAIEKLLTDGFSMGRTEAQTKFPFCDDDNQREVVRVSERLMRLGEPAIGG